MNPFFYISMLAQRRRHCGYCGRPLSAADRGRRRCANCQSRPDRKFPGSLERGRFTFLVFLVCTLAIAAIVLALVAWFAYLDDYFLE